ncbi:MAG: hypothetical protein ACJ8AI_10125, partial [Rhodopila sp.]
MLDLRHRYRDQLHLWSSFGLENTTTPLRKEPDATHTTLPITQNAGSNKLIEWGRYVVTEPNADDTCSLDCIPRRGRAHALSTDTYNSRLPTGNTYRDVATGTSHSGAASPNARDPGDALAENARLLAGAQLNSCPTRRTERET